MDKDKIKNFAVPFLVTVSAVFVGIALYKFVEKKMAKKETEKVAATK